MSMRDWLRRLSLTGWCCVVCPGQQCVPDNDQGGRLGRSGVLLGGVQAQVILAQHMSAHMPIKAAHDMLIIWCCSQVMPSGLHACHLNGAAP